MSADLAVVTFTKGNRPEWLELCVDSVRRNLPSGSTHYIIQCDDLESFHASKLKSLGLAKYLVTVDDDDLIINDSLRKCLEAVKQENVSVAFTDELKMNECGSILSTPPLRTGLSYLDAASSVLTVHHTVLFETAKVDNRISALIQNSGCYSGTDWLILASAALTGGAVHVPVHGYQWRQHSNNLHISQSNSFGKHFLSKQLFLKSLLRDRGLIKRLPEQAL